MKSIAVLALLVLLCGCTAIPMQRMAPASSSPGLEIDVVGGAYEPASLFSSDSAVLADADIDRILRYNYVSPQKARVAVLALGQDIWLGYSDELARSGEEVRSAFLSTLRRAPSVTTATYMPSLLVPSRHSVAYFREAATRFQADLLVVYQASCRTYEKYRIFSASSSKSYCNIEAVVLDVRTGIVPFTTSATQEFVATQQSIDANVYDTKRKAELSSIRDGLVKVGTQIARYLGARE